ncbi:MAG TPA: GntG family PLP-dependent aldolase [Nitrospirales bacterium]|nr:GntG family PLP-dependent aldolase [Nitrospirales bacterium]
MTTRDTPVDLRSDTVTKPTPAMREAMAQAPVGDDVYGEDPTVNHLQEAIARRLGKEAGLFVPSGIMANQLAIRVRTEPGDEVIVESRAHIVRYEHGAAAALAGVQLHWIPTERGILSAPLVESAIRPNDPYNPRTALICLEQTHNSGGGTITPLKTMAEIRAIANARGVKMHLDGARLFNAVVASGVSAETYAQHFESVSVCLSKGLGAPVGSVLASDADTILKLRRLRRMYGGGMRQAGILAAAGLHALEHHVDRLKDDHTRARRLARGLHELSGVSIDPDRVETNIVIFDLADARRSAAEVVAALRAQGVLLNPVGPRSLRAVTHLDVSDADIDRALDAFTRVLR